MLPCTTLQSLATKRRLTLPWAKFRTSRTSLPPCGPFLMLPRPTTDPRRPTQASPTLTTNSQIISRARTSRINLSPLSSSLTSRYVFKIQVFSSVFWSIQSFLSLCNVFQFHLFACSIHVTIVVPKHPTMQKFLAIKIEPLRVLYSRYQKSLISLAVTI